VANEACFDDYRAARAVSAPKQFGMEAGSFPSQREFPTMASWVKCTDLKAQTVWVNLDNVTIMTWRDIPQDTEIIFVGGGQVLVREQPESLTKRS
jgi:hypothetical protein